MSVFTIGRMTPWEFWIDVGGTFTDCLARTPDGELRTLKVLSSGIVKGQIESVDSATRFLDPLRKNNPPNFWDEYQISFSDLSGAVIQTTRVAAFDAATGALTLADPLSDGVVAGFNYELTSGQEAPILAIRYFLGLKKSAAIPPVVVKLGTTRGTNALLERKGARTAFVTTRGFRDVLLIANQDRPRLFDLAIQKPSPLFEAVVEVDERLDADGNVLKSPDAEAIRRSLIDVQKQGIVSIGICLLHAFANPDHEIMIEQIARDVGFREISRSSKLSPLIKIVSRGDTTVVDAYLNPILREYVQRLRSQLTESSLKIMTSAGGLVEAENFVGKDSLLSGPAGGVIGFSRVAEQAGFTHSIGFDMGGTSTDVSRFDGTYELEFETKKAGVRVTAPMLAIETVAAGGGSICDFDGVKLVVGPASAGADPGPACYGRGGPLTVTDVNFYLGKILPERFPFPLDFAAVENRLREIIERIDASAVTQKYTPRELAEGFVRVANANMVRAMRNISVAKGYDPADYVMVTFGGAGAQHSCALARELGMSRILIHPWAGVLSAYGIGLADVRRFGEQAVLKPYSDDVVGEIEPLFRDIERRLRSEVQSEGVPDERIVPPRRSLDLRYKWVEAIINVTRPEDGDYAREYAAAHRQLYGYTHANRPLEIVAARVEVVGRMPSPPALSSTISARVPEPARHTETWFGGKPHQTAVFFREDLQPGDHIVGPAIVCEPISTVVIDPGFEAKILASGELLLTDQGTSTGPRVSTEADPVMLEIFNNLFASIAEQMGITLQRTASSTNVKERLDFSCAVFSPKGDLVVNAPHIPVHLGAMSETVKRILADNPDLGPGDVFVTNDPYRGGSHLPDVTIVTPVHDAETGELRFLTASRAHHAEIGGIVPGSMPPFSKNLGEEGVLIRNFKLVDRGASREEEIRKLLTTGPYPTRSVADNMSDITAQVAANQSGVRLLLDLIKRYTPEVVIAYMDHIQRAASTKMRMALANIPDRTYSRTDHLDNDAPIAVTITKTGETATVDFTGTGPVLESNLNANRAIVTAAVLYVFRCLINEDIPLNSGVLEPVEIILPECLLNPPENRDPAKSPAMVGGNVETSQRVVDVLLGALGVAAASQGTMNNLTFGDETFGYYETICGGSGATPNADGTNAVHTHMTNTRLTDAEVIERRYPVRIHEFSIRHGSGGTGKHRGGDGIIRRIEFLKPVRVSILSERRGPYPPFGLAGGEPGQLGRNTLQKKNPQNQETVDDLGGKVSLVVEPGDILTIETPGGGGYGEPDGND
ncbi:MAG: hydantoinase B/oxoprolinase family protein [Planctomycetota bacterium]|nr:hydantoinase B/oxoprolinase family protein [Planctomycetota bacterium]